jgi:hypothetical protein
MVEMMKLGLLSSALSPARALRRLVSLVVVTVTLGTGCTGTGTHRGPIAISDDAPTRAELVCGPDGSLRLSIDRVQPQRDGVHLRVINRFDEPVSVEGFDANPGETDWVLTNGPGPLALMCWPYSQHRSGQEPQRVTLTIEDPSHLYFDGSLDCPIDSASSGDSFEQPVDYGPPSLARVLKVIPGLRPNDALHRTGYPSQDRAAVAVIRDGVVVASYGIMRFAGRPWEIVTGTACEGTGLKFAGESVT